MNGELGISKLRVDHLYDKIIINMKDTNQVDKNNMQNGEMERQASSKSAAWRKRFVTGVNYTHNETPTGSSIAANNAQQRRLQQ